mgnify:CR=1 FL=1
MSNADTGPPPDGDLNTTNPRTDDEFDIDALLADAERDLKAERVAGLPLPSEGMNFADAIPNADAKHREAIWQSLDDALAVLEAPDDSPSGHDAIQTSNPALH